jgi:ABC-type transport system involved in cytochrome c biogenesis permease subunit
MNGSRGILPWFLLVLAIAYVLAPLRPQRQQDFDLAAFARLPVSADGRTKPVDTEARTALMIISGRQSFAVDGKSQPPAYWLLDVMARPEVAADYELFRIDHPDVRSLMGLPTEGRQRFSVRQLSRRSRELTEQVRVAASVKRAQRNAYQTALVELGRHIQLYQQIQQFSRPFPVMPRPDHDEEWAPLVRFLGGSESSPSHPAADAWVTILRAWSRQDAVAFNTAVDQYSRLIADAQPREVTRARVEVVFNRHQTFYLGMVLYVAAFLLACLGMTLRSGGREAWATATNQSALNLMAVAVIIHTLGLLLRMYLQGRPPVTNLYSSAVFIGWGCALAGLVLERYQKLDISAVVGCVVGFSTLVIAHHLGKDGDTMEMMQAVLDSNFWLATHVIAISIGYKATFVAGGFGIIFILLGLFTRQIDDAIAKDLGRVMYGVICFALLFSFVGTVLGGIWADQSWGRFWGWDPKENGAVLIVLMNALILHARWGGMIQQRGIAVLAVSGNIITAWSWFGTNMLGIGLHAYGFMDSAVFWLLAFVATQLLVMAIGLLPLELWRCPWAQAAVAKQSQRPRSKSST